MSFDLPSTTPPRRQKVLAVDDDVWTLGQLGGFVAETGFEYESCQDPQLAVRRCAQAPDHYGLVLMDMRFGGAPIGFHAARAITRQGGNGPTVVGMTGCRDLYAYEERGAWGMSDMIAKPLFKWLVVNLVHTYCLPGLNRAPA